MSGAGRKPYIEWTPVDHYRAASSALEGIRATSDLLDSGEIKPTKATEDIFDSLLQRAQLHATLACVDPRIATLAMAKDHEEESDR